MRRPLNEWLVLATAVAAVFLLLGFLTAGPAGVSWNYLLSVLITIEIYALFSLGLSLEFGFTGLLNFGHVAFMAIGGYTVAIFVERLQALDPAFSTRIEGVTLGGGLVAALMALTTGALVAVPALFVAHRILRQRTPLQVPFRLGLAAGGVVAAAVFLLLFPLGAQQAVYAVVFLGVLTAMAFAALGGLVLGMSTVRLREDYLAIVTIGAAEVLRNITIGESWLTHGTLGINRVDRPTVDWALETQWWRDLADALDVRPASLLHAVLGIALIAYVFFVLELLIRSPWGRVLKAIRDDEDVAAALGKNPLAYKLQSLMIGSAVAALSGVFLVWHLSNVYPEHFPHLITFFGFIIVVIGGMGNHKGTLAGAVLLWGVFEAGRNVTLLAKLGFRDVAGPPQAIAVGVLLILFVLFRPQGLLGNKEELVHAR